MAGQMGYGQLPTGPVKPSSFLGGSILVTLFCCLPFGVVALVYSLLVHSRWNSGDHEGSAAASEMAEKWMYASVGAWVILFIIGLLYNFVFKRFAG